MDVDVLDPIALRAAARADRKSLGRLSQLILASLRLVWSSGRSLLIGLVVLQLVAAAALAAQVLAVQSVLHAVLTASTADNAGLLVASIAALAVLTAVSAISTALQTQRQRMLGETVARSMWSRVLGVATRVDLLHFESPEFYNRLNRVQTSAMVRPYQVTQGLLSVVGALVSAVGLGMVLLSFSPILLPLVMIGGIPILLSSRRESRLEFAFTVKQTPAVRLRGYFTLLQTGRDEAKEVRAFGLAPWLLGRFDGLYERYLADLRRHVRQRATLSLFGQLGSALVLGATLLALAGLIVWGRIDVAGAGAALVAIRMLATQVQAMARGVQSIFESGLFLDDLAAFLRLGESALEDDAGEPAPEGFELVRAQGVSFRYPGSDIPALDEVDIELRAGEIVALVGENGSGKTTLAKLLAGLYSADEGSITWDGVDVSTYQPSSLRDRVTIVFQDFVRYALTAAENISVGRVGEPLDLEGVHAAASSAGIESAIDELPRGFDTVLSRMFVGGRDLSGGQWQRIALARSFYRNAPLVILDEPSASLDPRAEHALFSTLRESLRGRTALFISHRFSTVRGADRIYVLHGGRVVEVGSHDELLRIDGRYADLYRLQSDAYVAPAGRGGSEPTGRA